jgi:hypothetical protein
MRKRTTLQETDDAQRLLVVLYLLHTPFLRHCPVLAIPGKASGVKLNRNNYIVHVTKGEDGTNVREVYHKQHAPKYKAHVPADSKGFADMKKVTEAQSSVRYVLLVAVLVFCFLFFGAVLPSRCEDELCCGLEFDFDWWCSRCNHPQ